MSGNARHGDPVGPGSLKIVVATGCPRTASAAIAAALQEHVGGNDIHALGPDVWLIHTARDAGDVRDVLSTLAAEGSIFVAEFESWAGYGGAIDRRWLLRRGH